jgi:hypothetical protein
VAGVGARDNDLQHDEICFQTDRVYAMRFVLIWSLGP